MSGHPSRSKSATATPMLANGSPLPVSASPRDMASFLNVPSRWFTHRWFAAPSLVTNRSGQPSPVKSAAYTPSPGVDLVGSPAGTVTSANRTGFPSPGPRLWNNRGMVPGNDLGPQNSRVPSVPLHDHDLS